MRKILSFFVAFGLSAVTGVVGECGPARSAMACADGLRSRVGVR
jgi:hypothetical protein